MKINSVSGDLVCFEMSLTPRVLVRDTYAKRKGLRKWSAAAQKRGFACGESSHIFFLCLGAERRECAFTPAGLRSCVEGAIVAKRNVVIAFVVKAFYARSKFALRFPP